MSNPVSNNSSVIKRLQREIVRATLTSREGHIASAYSILDILWVLYSSVLQVYPSVPKHGNRDRFILSKGHGSLALYAVLAEKGFFPAKDLERFSTFESNLGGHPDCNKVPGVETSTGSLGHGFPMAVGMAMGLKIKNSTSRVYCLIGDGEANEGSIWEAALLARHHKLDNLCCIIDFNHSTDRALDLGDVAAKFRAFGFETTTIDGHDHVAILESLNIESNSPRAIVARTIKGHGCQVMENNPAWHHRSPGLDELKVILDQLS
ncbi:MAG: transketolase [Verrucomicrobiae bacterium]